MSATYNSQFAIGAKPPTMTLGKEPVREPEGPTGIQSPIIDITNDTDDDDLIQKETIAHCKKKVGGMIDRLLKAQDHVNMRIYYFCTACSGRFRKRADLVVHMRMTHKIIVR